MVQILENYINSDLRNKKAKSEMLSLETGVYSVDYKVDFLHNKTK